MVNTSDICVYIDADACPVKEETYRVAERHGLKTFVVSNGGIRPSRDPMIETIVVSHGADAADDWIVDHVSGDDIVVTSDIPLADRCIDKGSHVLGPTGKPFTKENIGMALAMRELKQHLREANQSQTYNASFSKNDRSNYLQSLDRLISAAKKSKSSH